MMSLFLSQGSDAVHKIQSLLEIRESESAVKVMLVDHLPLWYLLVKGFEFFAFKGGNASAAGYASLAGERCHRKISAHIVAVKQTEERCPRVEAGVPPCRLSEARPARG
jgi:hypothetical protein